MSKQTKSKSKSKSKRGAKHAKEGNPFFAFRVPAKLLVGYCRKVGGRPKACAAIREHMSRVSGVIIAKPKAVSK